MDVLILGSEIQSSGHISGVNISLPKSIIINLIVEKSSEKWSSHDWWLSWLTAGVSPVPAHHWSLALVLWFLQKRTENPSLDFIHQSHPPSFILQTPSWAFNLFPSDVDALLCSHSWWRCVCNNSLLYLPFCPVTHFVFFSPPSVSNPSLVEVVSDLFRSNQTARKIYDFSSFIFHQEDLCFEWRNLKCL